MDVITTLGRTLGFSFAAGVNLYATVAMLGLASRFGWVDLPEQFGVFNNDFVIAAAVVMYLVEFFADKIPYVDTIWDIVHTAIRPFGGALIAVATLGDASPAMQGLIALLGGTVAAGSHLTKTSTRAMANTSPEPFSNWFLSLGEDRLRRRPRLPGDAVPARGAGGCRYSAGLHRRVLRCHHPDRASLVWAPAQDRLSRGLAIQRFAVHDSPTLSAPACFKRVHARPAQSLCACLCRRRCRRAGACPESNPAAADVPRRHQLRPRRYVRLDADGVPITDLRREELELLEDGKPQAIKDFEHVQVDTFTPQELRIEPNSVEESRQMAGDGRARIFVVFLDTFHTNIEGSANMRTPLVRFLDRAMGSNDMVAVMTPEMSASDVTFGRKTTVISNIMQREWTWGRRNRIEPLDAKEALYTACYRGDEQLLKAMKERRREKQTLDALEDLITHLQGIREERKAILTISEGWRLFQPDAKLANRGGSEVPGVERLFVPADRARNSGGSGVDKAQCDADRIALAQIDDAQRMREIGESANRGNVTFYPMYARGLAVFDSDIGPDPPPSIQEDAAILRNNQASLRGLAIDTDGTAIINTNDIEGGISRIVADLSSYYLLGYESTNSKLDGKFRSITVRVKRPDTKVRARRGYRALTAEEVMTRTDRDNPGTATADVPPAVVVNPRAPFRLRSAAWTVRCRGLVVRVVVARR